MNILVLNSGSSSVKYRLFDMGDRSLLAGGAAERIGEAASRLSHVGRSADGSMDHATTDCSMPDHAAALDRITEQLGKLDLPDDASGLAAIGHRVAHGGEIFRAPTLLDAGVVEAIRALSTLAPLHNPANLLGIEVALARRPDVPQVAVFDTAFHHTIPPHAHRYAVPKEWYETYGVRRYGFHGTSCAYVAKQAASFLGRPLGELNLIVLHLGNGASVTAIAGGVSVDTSMGLTPLEGLVMGTRSGDLDPASIFHIARQSDASLDEIESALNSRSGLAGLCGKGDVRDVLASEEAGDEDAHLALDLYCYRIRKYIGAYMAALARVDAVVFTAGVGENSADIRERACQRLERFGVEIDPGRNRGAAREMRAIQPDGARVSVLVVPTNEELEIAEQTVECIPDPTGAGGAE